MSSTSQILLVEDDVDDVELIIIGLRRRHLANDVVVAAGGREALDYLFRRSTYADRQGAEPMLILLDLKMPRLDGGEVLRQVKQDPHLRRIPIVVLTSSAHDRDVVRSYELGANAYVVKPVEFVAFADVVARLGVFWLTVNQPPPVDDWGDAPSPPR